jgi:DNA repair exonuclease SbcCD ATPase subunit
MPTLKILKLEIEGFRSFGPPQTIWLNNGLCLVQGENSQGKTSLAEALEFLFCGTTSRRDLVAATKTEFAGSLKNTHYVGSTVVTVTLTGNSGSETTYRRTLLKDYPDGNKSCESRLELLEKDGKWSPIIFSSADQPIRLPFIFQHTLRYVSSAKQGDRREYFSQLLDVTDVNSLRETLKKVVDAWNPLPVDQGRQEVFLNFKTLSEEPQFRDLQRLLGSGHATSAEFDRVLSAQMLALLKPYVKAGALPQTEEQISDAFRKQVPRLRSLVSNLPSLELLPLASPWETSMGAKTELEPLIAGIEEAAKNYNSEAGTISEQLVELIHLLEAAENLPQVRRAGQEPIDCPLCLTPRGLTSWRIEEIRSSLSKPRLVKRLADSARNSLEQTTQFVDKMSTYARQTLSGSLRNINVEEVKAFSEESIGQYNLWESAHAEMLSAHQNFESNISNVSNQILGCIASISANKTLEADGLKVGLTSLVDSFSKMLQKDSAYSPAAKAHTEIIYSKIDEVAGANKMSALLDLWDHRRDLELAVQEFKLRETVDRNFGSALQAITTANAELLRDVKYPELSSLVAKWWNMLRPNEPVTFDSVRPKGQALREIDIKATIVDNFTSGLQRNVERDAVAVFSDSQLNCLGLALFFARSERESSGFVVLDDPIQSLDRDHADNLVKNVLKEFLTVLGVQVILLTHDKRFWGDIRTLYGYLAPKGLKVKRIAGKGAVVEDFDSRLEELFAVIAVLEKIDEAGSFEIAANRLRVAIEVFCKEIISKFGSSDEKAILPSHFDGQMLPQLLPKASLYLNLDKSHSSTLAYLVRKVNPGSHDSVSYSTGSNVIATMKGDLQALAKSYGLLN